MYPLLSVDVHKPYMPSELFAHMDFAMKLYIVCISLLSLANSSMQ